MQLPKLDTPTYELTLPSTNDIIKYRPFLVKEEKILLMAQESKEDREIANATVNLIDACTFNKLNVKKLPVFDIEYILLQIRAKSVGEIVTTNLICQDDLKTVVPTKIDLTKIDVQIDEEHTNKIIIDEKRNLGVVFNYPTFEMASQGVDVRGTDVEKIFDLLSTCVDHIFEGETIYHRKDMEKNELKEFFESMKQSQFEKVQKFFNSMPTLIKEFEIENPKTKVKSTVVLRGLNDFF